MCEEIGTVAAQKSVGNRMEPFNSEEGKLRKPNPGRKNSKRKSTFSFGMGFRFLRGNAEEPQLIWA